MKQQAVSSPRGPYKKSAGTRAAIIKGAIDLLIEEGYHNFSLRKVAARSQVSIGNVQHHFESKEKLISTMLDDVITGYVDEFQNLIQQTDSPEEQLRIIVRRVVEDLGTKETTMFFPELWSLANHEHTVEELMHEMYGRYRDIYKGIIPAINPDLSEEQVERAALFISSSLEGHTMFIGHGKKDNHQLDVIADMAYAAFLHMIKSGRIPA